MEGRWLGFAGASGRVSRLYQETASQTHSQMMVNDSKVVSRVDAEHRAATEKEMAIAFCTGFGPTC